MKRFTTEGTNDQEGLGLIPAQRRAEEAPPLGLSFEGGVAGARTFSRRQAKGLLGGSLAGLTLFSLGLAEPAKAPEPARPGPPVGSDIRRGTIITLECLGDKPGPRWLDGRTANGTVGLAPNTNPPHTGTKWTVFCVIPELYASHPDQTIMLRCEGNLPGPRWLDSRTDAGDVGLAPNTNPSFTGTRWAIKVVQAPPAA